ncbi:MAG: hypothetical protein N2662_03130 [Bacteroidales bacterium]|nr:hypothetical protein [Bacteroidales bacterium]
MIKKIIFIASAVILIGVSIYIIYINSHLKPHENLDVPYEEVNKGVIDIEVEAVKSITENISSPIEIAALIKEMGVPFNRDFLAPTDYVSNYSTNYAQAFALGVFSADLGYLNMYNKTGSVIDYLTTIKNLADAINVGQYFDFATLKRLASNSSNVDSLKYISVHSFNQIDQNLRQRKRGNLSALIIAGAWLEGIYITIQVSKIKPDPKLLEKIGEQKIILSDLMTLLASYAKDPIFKNYVNEFNSIKAKFDEVQITYEQGEPVTVVENGMMTVVQKDRSIVHITTQQLNDISQTVELIRNRLIRQ